MKFGTLVDFTEIIMQKNFLKTLVILEVMVIFENAIFACSASTLILKSLFIFS